MTRHQTINARGATLNVFCQPSIWVLYIFVSLLANASARTTDSTPLDAGALVSRAILSPGNGTITDEIHCYALPYGGIGVLSHVLTYWTIGCLAFGRMPIAPWWPLRQRKFDLFLTVASLAACIPMTIVTIIRCKARWQFVLVAVWKTTMSFTLGCVSMHRAFDQEDPDPTPLFWLAVYLVGTIVGMTGLGSIVSHTFKDSPNVRLVTYIFIAVGLGTAGLVTLIHWLQDSSLGKVWVFALSLVVCFGVSAALYSDMVLAAIANRWSGAPSGDNAVLYWVYFVFKRLPTFSQ